MFFKRTDYQHAELLQSDQEEYLYLDEISLVPINTNEAPCATSDSLKKILYSHHDRHSRLMKYRLAFINNPPKLRELDKTLIKSIDTLAISDITFKSNASSLDTAVLAKINALLSAISLTSIDSLVVEGYADSSGSHFANLRLSKERTSSVFDYISANYRELGDKMKTRFFGDKKPLEANSTLSGRNRNRRVAVFIYTTK